MTGGHVIWDFDGTLAYRDGMWSGTLLEILAAEEPALCVTRDDLHPLVRSRFPWHRPELPHTDIGDAETWWHMLSPVFEDAFATLGLSVERAAELAAQVPAQYCRLEKWRLFEDTVPALRTLAQRGWSHVMLSNHVPELPEIVAALGVSHYFREIHTSAVIGFEKPHPDAFRVALRSVPDASRVWMIGDNPDADIRGAAELGIPGILVRKTDRDVQHQCDGLMAAAEIILGREDSGGL